MNFDLIDPFSRINGFGLSEFHNLYQTICCSAQYNFLLPPRSKIGGWGAYWFLSLSFPKSVWNFNLALVIIFEDWKLGLWYFTWVFLVARSFLGYQHFYPVTLTSEFDLFFKNKTLLIFFEQWLLELWYFTWVFYETRPTILTLWPWP